MEASDRRTVDLDGDELTPAEADAELLERGPELAAAGDHDEIERLAAIGDQGDPEVAEREMPDSAGWTEGERAEIIAGWRRKRRSLPYDAMWPGETAAEWWERTIAQMVAEHGCAPLVVPARRPEDVLEVDLATVPRRKRRRLFKRGGSKSHDATRRRVLRVLGDDRPAARRTPTARPAARRPRRSSSSSRTSGVDPGEGDDDSRGEPAGVSCARLPAQDRGRSAVSADIATGAAPVAHVLIRGRRGVFLAETCEVADGIVTATGRTRWSIGANYVEHRWGPRECYSWPTRDLRQIRWIEEPT